MGASQSHPPVAQLRALPSSASAFQQPSVTMLRPPPSKYMPKPDEPEVKRVVAAIAWSRSFVLTYHIVVLGVICFFALIHLHTKLRLYRRARRLFSPSLSSSSSSTSSSSSSTLNGTPSPSSDPNLEDTPILESTPLLTSSSGRLPRRRPRFRTSRIPLYPTLRAFLLYQPHRPIPLLNRPLPPNGTTLVIILFLLLNAFYALFNMRPPHKANTYDLSILAVRFSLVFVANLPLLYLLAAKNQPLTHLTGFSHESLNILHRRLGSFLILLGLVHGLAFTTVWYILLRPNGFTFTHYLTTPVVTFGIGALTAYGTLYFTSLAAFRTRWYEAFLAIHIAMQAVGLGILFTHAGMARVYVGVAVAIFLADRIWFRLYHKSVALSSSSSPSPYPGVDDEPETQPDEGGDNIEITVLPDGLTLLLTATIPPSRRFTWRATDHVFLTVPAFSRFQAHPFAIFSPPPPPPRSEKSASPLPPSSSSTSLATLPLANTTTASKAPASRLQLLIRPRAGMTHHLLMHALMKRTLPAIRLDGPYGSPRARDMLAGKDTAVLVAGGSGIAVIYPLLHSLVADAGDHAGQKRGGASGKAIAQRKKKVLVVWVVHERTHLIWLPDNALHDFEGQDKHAGVEVEVSQHVTQETGRPVVGSLMRAWLAGNVPEAEDGVGEEEGEGGVGVVVAGPEGMNRHVRNAVAGLVRRGWGGVDVVVEKFGW